MKKEDLLILKDLVRGEAAKLREIIKPSEAAKLDFRTLEGNSTEFCIYGQLTGHCFSSRANGLILKCCERVYKAEGDIEMGCPLNGKPKRVKPEYRGDSHWSPIEKWLATKATKKAQKNLVQYLKKEVDTLDI